MRGLGVMLVILTLALALWAMPVDAAEDHADGEDYQPDLTDLPITAIAPDDVSLDETPFELDVTLTPEAAGNGTVVSWQTQICINSGICYPWQDGAMTEDAGVWSGSVMTPEDHTYVHYQIVLDWADDENDTFSDYGKTWSSCWRSSVDGELHGDGCGEDGDEDGDGLPAPGVAVIAVGLFAAALAAGMSGRRD